MSTLLDESIEYMSLIIERKKIRNFVSGYEIIIKKFMPKVKTYTYHGYRNPNSLYKKTLLTWWMRNGHFTILIMDDKLIFL